MAQSTVKLIVDAQNAIRPLQRVNQQTQNLNKNTNKLKDSLNKSNTSLRATGRAATSASGGFRTLNKSLGPLLKVLAAIAAVKFVFVQSADIETQRKSLEVLTGSLSKTNKIIQELQDFGAVTPFTSSELIEQSKRLKAFGFTTDELSDSVKRLSDIAGATGADLSGIATAFGQIRAKGKLQQEENLQLLERGVDITTELKKITGLQGEEFESAMRKGKIGADLVNEAFINLTNEGGAFFGGATAQADTLNGKLSTLIDSVQGLARTIGEVLGPAIKTALSLATSAVQTIDKLIKRVQNITQLGLKNVLQAENAAKKTAERLTKLKFGDDVNLGLFGNKEAKKFQEEQFNLLVKQNIEREKLKNKQFEETELIKQANQQHSQTVTKIQEKSNATDQFNFKLEESFFQIQKIQNETSKLNSQFLEIGMTIENGIVSNLTDTIMGVQSLGQAAIGVLNSLKRKIIEVALQNAVSGLGRGIAGSLGGLFGGGLGGGLVPFIPGLGGAGFGGGGISPLLGFANGGRPPVGRASIVGERGPEIFVPGVSGTIMPNSSLGGSTNIVNVSVNASGSNVSGNNADANQLGQLIGTAIQAQLIKEKRPGGLLA